MTTTVKNQQATVVLKDGNTPLAVWNQSFDRQPALGEPVEIPARFRTALAGYESLAAVWRIERREPLPSIIDLEATCVIERQHRPMILINSERIPESLRSAVEAYLRATLQFPIIDWEPSMQPDPVVRFRDPSTGRKLCPSDVRAGLLDLLYQPAST